MVAWLIMAASSVTSLPSLLTESQRWRITALARVTQTKIYAHTYTLANKRQQAVRLRLSVGHGEYRTTGTYCICSRDPALPASDNRITANWTLGFSPSLCYFSCHWITLSSPRYPVSPPPLLPLGFTSSWKIIFHCSAGAPDTERERERGSGSEGVKTETTKRWIAVGPSDKETGNGQIEEQSREESETDVCGRKQRGVLAEDGEEKEEIEWREKTRGKTLHSPTPSLIRKYNIERGLRWIKCGR